MLWLEEQRIRHYEVVQRSGLREVNSEQWPSHFEIYLKSIACPYTENRVQALCWLLGTALHLEDKYGAGGSPTQCNVTFPNIDCKLTMENFGVLSREKMIIGVQSWKRGQSQLW